MPGARASKVVRVLITALVLSAGFAIAYLISGKYPLISFVVLLVTGLGLGIRNAHPLGIPVGGFLGGVLIEALWRATHDASGESPNSFSFSIELGLALSLVAVLPGWLLGRAFMKATDPPSISRVEPATAQLPTGESPAPLPGSDGAPALLLAVTAIAILVGVFVLFYWFASNLFPPNYAG